jgi:hypothetical protein
MTVANLICLLVTGLGRQSVSSWIATASTSMDS